NWQAGPVVYGLETDLQISGVRGDTGSYDMPHARLDWFGTTRARLGFVPTERLFAYATGGLAYGRVKTHGDFLSASALRTGGTAGAGMEFAIDRHWSVKSEYLYTDLGKLGIDEGIYRHETDFRFHTVRAGLNYRF